MSEIEKEKLKVLLEEYKIITQRIESFINSQRLFFFQGLVFVFGLLAVFKDYKEVLLALPLVVIIYVAIFLYQYQRTQTNQLYKKRIEGKINSLCNDNVLFYTRLGVDIMEKKNKFVFFNILSYSVLIIISIVAFITYFTGTDSGVNKLFIICTAIVLIVLLLVFVLAVLDIPRKMRRIVDEYLPEIDGEESRIN